MNDKNNNNQQEEKSIYSNTVLPSKVIFELQKIALADDVTAKKENAGIKFRDKVKSLLFQFGIDERKYFCRICSTEIKQAAWFCDECSDMSNQIKLNNKKQGKFKLNRINK